MVLTIFWDIGVDITTWRRRIAGKFSYSQAKTRLPFVCSFMRINASPLICLSFRTCAALAILLVLAGVEVNPGPVTCNELAAQSANLSTLVTNSFAQCNAKIDGFLIEVNDLKLKYSALETSINTQITALKASLASLKSELDTVSSKVDDTHITWPKLSPGGTKAVSSSNTINDLATEMKLRDSKKLNIIIQGMPSAADDLAAFLSLVDKELKLKPLVTSVKRLVSKSKAPNTPRPTGPAAPAPLLVTLRDASDRRLLLSNAKVFRSSADVYVKDSIFINPDLMLMER